MPLLIDGHLDIAMNALMLERDQTLSLAELRRREVGATGDGRDTATVTLPQMRLGGVALAVATVIARAKPWVAVDRKPDRQDLDWPCQEMAYAAAQGQLAYYREMHRRGQVRIIADRPALDAHWAQWTSVTPLATDPLACDALPVGLIIMMEGADPIVDPEQAHDWAAQGLRCLSLAHFGHSHYAAGTPSRDPASPEQDGPLTPRGRQLLKLMQDLPIALDLTHLSDTSFFNAIDAFAGPVCATHANARALAPSPRQITDEQIKLIIERDGVIGMAMYKGMIRFPDGQEPPRTEVSLKHVADHVDHICQLAGSAAHVGIGSDLDGGFGIEFSPCDLDSIADLQKLDPLLKARGYSDADVNAVCHGNWLRFWRNVMPGP